MMYHCIAMEIAASLDAKNFEDVGHSSLYQPVDYRQKTPKKKTVVITTVVVETTASRPGHVTCFISTRTSCRNSRVSATVPETFSPIPAAAPLITLLPDSSFFTFTGCVAIKPSSLLGTPIVRPVLRFPALAERCNLWQGRRDSNPHTRFWRPES